MKKIVFIVSFLFLSQNVQAKVFKWDFEADSLNTETFKCIKVIDVKSNKSSLAALGNFIASDVPFIIRIQNNCSDEVRGDFTLKLLDDGGFSIYQHYLQEFRIGRKGISKNSFQIYISHLKWRKVKSVRLEFDFETELDKKVNKMIEDNIDNMDKKTKSLIYGN